MQADASASIMGGASFRLGLSPSSSSLAVGSAASPAAPPYCVRVEGEDIYALIADRAMAVLPTPKTNVARTLDFHSLAAGDSQSDELPTVEPAHRAEDRDEDGSIHQTGIQMMDLSSHSSDQISDATESTRSATNSTGEGRKGGRDESTLLSKGGRDESTLLSRSLLLEGSLESESLQSESLESGSLESGSLRSGSPNPLPPLWHYDYSFASLSLERREGVPLPVFTLRTRKQNVREGMLAGALELGHDFLSQGGPFVALYDVRSLALPSRAQLKTIMSWVPHHSDALDENLQEREPSPPLGYRHRAEQLGRAVARPLDDPRLQTGTALRGRPQ